MITITERIYVDAKGKPVAAGDPKAARLAAVPGDTVSEARAAELGVKAKAQGEDKAREQGENKGIFKSLSKRS